MRFNIYACNGGKSLYTHMGIIPKINDAGNFALNEILSAMNTKEQIFAFDVSLKEFLSPQ